MALVLTPVEAAGGTVPPQVFYVNVNKTGGLLPLGQAHSEGGL